MREKGVNLYTFIRRKTTAATAVRGFIVILPAVPTTARRILHEALKLNSKLN